MLHINALCGEACFASPRLDQHRPVNLGVSILACFLKSRISAVRFPALDHGPPLLHLKPADLYSTSSVVGFGQPRPACLCLGRGFPALAPVGAILGNEVAEFAKTDPATGPRWCPPCSTGRKYCPPGRTTKIPAQLTRFKGQNTAENARFSGYYGPFRAVIMAFSDRALSYSLVAGIFCPGTAS